jgi:hypothetical protein
MDCFSFAVHVASCLAHIPHSSKERDFGAGQYATADLGLGNVRFGTGRNLAGPGRKRIKRPPTRSQDSINREFVIMSLISGPLFSGAVADTES